VAAKRPITLVYVTVDPITQWAFLRGQNDYMRAHGIELHAISSPDPLLDELGQRDHVAVHAVPIARELAPVRDLRSVLKIFLTLRRIKADIVHMSNAKAAFLAALAARVARVPIRVFLVRGLASSVGGARGRAYGVLERLTARLCNAVLCNSQSLLREARKAGILRAGEGMVPASGMSNGVDAARFSRGRVAPVDLGALGAPAAIPSGGRRVLGFVGRFTRDKGFDMIEPAWRTISQEFPSTVLLLVGGWDAALPVPDAVRERLERDERVIVTGHVDDVVPYLEAMDLLLFPSRREGFPNAPMEAAAMGLPVVATRVVGCVDAVEDGVTGTLVPYGDVASFAAAIRRYLQDDALRETHGQAGRRRVLSSFQPERVWKSVYEEYRRLVAEHLPGRSLPPAR